jgi:hypothetical protein
VQALAIACMGTWIVSTDLFARAVLRERENGTGALVFSAAGAQQRMLAIRTSVALSLAVIPVLPALIRLSVSAPTMALALLMTATSVALAGLAIGVVCRNPRPFELLLVALAYAGAQGEPLLNVATDPSFSVTAHAIVVPITAILLIVLWPLHAGTPVQSGGWQRFLSARAG